MQCSWLRRSGVAFRGLKRVVRRQCMSSSLPGKCPLIGNLCVDCFSREESFSVTIAEGRTSANVKGVHYACTHQLLPQNQPASQMHSYFVYSVYAYSGNAVWQMHTCSKPSHCCVCTPGGWGMGGRHSRDRMAGRADLSCSILFMEHSVLSTADRVPLNICE